MKHSIPTSVVALLLAPIFTAFSQDIYFNDADEHTFADSATNVFVGNNTKLTLLPGSSVTNYVHVYESSELVVDGGSADSVQVFTTSSITVLDGSVLGYVFLYGSSTGAIRGGSITNACSLEPVITNLSPSSGPANGPGVATVEITGGDINRLQAPAQGEPLGQTSHATVNGGTISEVTMNSPFSTLEIAGGVFDGGFFSGNVATVSGGTFNLTSKIQMAGDGVLTFCGQSDLAATLHSDLNIDYSINGTLESGDVLSNVLLWLTGNSILVLKTAIDTDNDGVPDDEDAFPEDPTEWSDFDEDGVGDNADEFPNSNTDPEFYACGLIIDNVQLENGAWLADEIGFALATDVSTPELVHELQEYRNAEFITGREMGQIIRAHNLDCELDSD